MRVERLDLGLVNGYLVRGQGGDLLIDTGWQRSADRLLRLLRQAGSGPERLRLVILTHVHLDHVGGLACLLRQTGPLPVLVHSADAPWLAEGRVSTPRGLNGLARLATGLTRALSAQMRLVGHEATYQMTNRFSLTPFGVEGEVLHTPGHTAGSVSVLLPGGEAVVGDLCQNQFGFGMGMGRVRLPLADRPELLPDSWRRVVTAGARRILPGHGSPFPVDWLKRILDAPGPRPTAPS